MINDFFRSLVLLIALLATASCATPLYQATATKVVKGNKTVYQADSIKEDVPYATDIPVEVYFRDRPPAGLKVTTGDEFRTSKEFNRKWMPIGSVSSEQAYQDSEMKTFKEIFWHIPLNDNHGSFRRTACSIQAPLKTVTFGLWSLIPTYWPCMSSYPEEGDNLEFLFIELKRAAKKMGGDMLVLLYHDKRITADAVVAPKNILASVREDVVRLTALVFKKKGRNN